MRLLIVSPDYASHAAPLVQLGRAWAAEAGDVVVATGPAVRSMVERAGLQWVELRLGRGSNPGVIEVARQPKGEDAHLQAFFDATRAGPVATLRYQADARRHDLMHDPDGVLDRLTTVIAAVQPDRVAVDHVAFGARLALHALGVPAALVVLGHPSALPDVRTGEVYGLPDRWPVAMQPAAGDLADLHHRCTVATDELRAAANELVHRRAPGVAPPGDLTSRPGTPTIYAYPSALRTPGRTIADDGVFVGSLAAPPSHEQPPLPTGDGLRVTVALGSFLGARGDVLRIAVDAARRAGWRLVLAHGSTPLTELGPLPAGAVVAAHIAQVATLAHTDVVVHHGGNGSVTESLAAGVPMVVLPFSTDQFAGAAAVEAAGVGEVLAPNELSVDALLDVVVRMHTRAVRSRAAELAVSLAADGGAARAVAAIAAGEGVGRIAPH